MSAQRDHWTELASRETDGLLVSLHWSSQDGDLKVAVADLRLRTRREFAVAGSRRGFCHNRRGRRPE